MEKAKRGRPAKYPWYTMEVGEEFVVPKKMITIPPKAFDGLKVYAIGRVHGGIYVERVA